MANIKSKPTSITVTVASQPGTFPYALPASKQAVLIGTNSADSIKPTSHSSADWSYSLFGSFGGGTYVQDFSSGGAYVLAATGGHIHPPNFGAAVFDFSDATWKRIDNTNGMPWRNNDLTRAEINTEGEIAIGGVTPDSMPAPTHTYNNCVPMPSSLGGGAKGSLILLISTAATVEPTGSHRAHRFDLVTGKWTRLSTNRLSNATSSADKFGPESPSVFDPVSKIYYQLPSEVHNVNTLPYLDSSDWTWKTSAGYPYPPSVPGYSVAWIEPNLRLLMIQHPDRIRALDLKNISAGLKDISFSGALPSGANLWHYYPADGCCYTYSGLGQQIHKLTPPASNPLTSSWTISTVTIGGASLPTDVGQIEHQTRHYSRFFYVPALQCFAWIPGGTQKVALLKP